MTIFEQELIESAVSDWDTAVFGVVRLPCVYSAPYEAVFEDVGGTAPTARVAAHHVEGTNKLVTLDPGTTQVTVETYDGRTVGPFVVEVNQDDGDGFRTLILRTV